MHPVTNSFPPHVINNQVEEQNQILENIFVDIGRWNWSLVQELIRENPEIDFDASPADKDYAGMTVLWLLAKYQQWNLLRARKTITWMIGRRQSLGVGRS